MKKIIKLTESDLTQLIKKIIIEQKETDSEYKWITNIIKNNPGYVLEILESISLEEVKDTAEEFFLTIPQAFECLFTSEFTKIIKDRKLRNKVESYISVNFESHIERSIYLKWKKIHNL